MELIDTHAHLDYPDFEADLEGVIARATEAGVTRIITIGTGLESSRRAVMLSERFPNVFAVVGVHPNNVAEEGLDFLPTLRELATHPKVVAIGETGIDYHHLPEDLQPPKVASVDEALLAQCSNIDTQVLHVGVGGPYLLQDHLVRQHLASVLNQQPEHRVFPWRQLHLLTADGHKPAHQIDRQIAAAEYRCFALRL